MQIDMLWLERKRQLVRGRWLVWRGAVVGKRLGIGRNTQIDHPAFLTIGDDVLIQDNCYLNCLAEKRVMIGSQTILDRNIWLHCGGTAQSHQRGFVHIGTNTYIGGYSMLGAGGGLTIGNDVLIGQNVNFHAENHRFADPDILIRLQGVKYQGIIVEDDVWIGSKATILDGVTLGKGAVVGAGSVVTKPVPPNAVVVGVPARVIDSRDANRNLP